MILQMVRNECVKFDRYIDTQLNYKILWFKVSNNPQTLHNPPCFDEGYFEAILIINSHRTLEVKIS